LTTSLTEKWYSQQVDYTNAFAQAELKEEVYIEYTQFFRPKSKDNRCLKLKKSLNRLKQAPQTFFEKLKAGLEQRQWKDHEVDPCLLYKSK
jgi:Reverse transcriptase (RNA-dependent DNA polymerase)